MKQQKVIGLIQLTNRRHIDSSIVTTQGEIPFIRWLLLEKIRIEKDPTRKTEIIFGKKGYLKSMVALYVNPPTNCKCKVHRII